MIKEDLLSKFDNIEELPVSEEMLGAYLEEKLSPSEMAEISSIAEDSPYLQAVLDSCADEVDYDIEIPDYHSIDNYDLPIVPNDAFIGLDISMSTIHQEMDSDEILSEYGMVASDVSDTDDALGFNFANSLDDEDFLSDSSDDNNASDYE